MPKPRGADTPEAIAMRARNATTRRGNRLQLAVARIELTLAGFEDVDRLLVLNTALKNVLDDSAARDAGRRP
jgi:hypothetical protein